MELRPSEQQVMLRESAVRYLRDAYSFDARRADLRNGGHGLWRNIGELGWTGAALPEACGGLGGGAVELSILMEELSRALYVGPFLSTAIGAAMLRTLDGARAASLVEQVATGGCRLALALGEPGGRGFFDIATAKAEPVQGGLSFRLSGRKRLAHDITSADLAIVSAAMPGGQGLFLVDPAARGLARRDYRTLDNGFASDLEFDGVEAELIAAPPTAAPALDDGFYSLAVALGAEAVGVADAALKATQDYAGVRKQFGKALSDFQVVQHRIADMFVEIEQLKASLLHALSLEIGDRAERRRVAMGLKILGGQVAAKVAGDGLHLHGGMGMTDEMPISHFYRRARMIEAQYGNSDYFLAEYAKGFE